MNKKIIKSFVGAIALVLVGCGSNDTETDSYDQIVEEGTFTIGLDDTFAPMGFRDSNGEVVGFDIDLANEVGDRLDLNVEFQPIDWALKETELNNGNIDAIWNGYTITDERKEQVDFSTPYLENSQIIIVLEDSSIQTIDDLSGKVVAAQQSSSAVDAVNADPSNIVEEFANQEIVLYPSNNDVFNDLGSGRSDAIVVDETLGRYYMKQNDDIAYRVLEENFGEEEYAVGFRKVDDQLTEAVNGALEEMKADGTFEEIYGKWFSE
ncbi:amino acid ABC transporter substrate-binding protein [Desemzia sp. RIT804]|uniref:amino acid ABC transporter substrate-binding protein n=1 Tax=Desemzia sp. RIT 804 TaxID=2810209 RepID=UPI00194EF9AF|nr:amino acid ABC transporter substrate-binding protein [Desemzia sp. RIT 804]MBM6613548.1 amino acid ABC transporter substrate-binding protein [Desemzia sp. RIT 804]